MDSTVMYSIIIKSFENVFRTSDNHNRRWTQFLLWAIIIYKSGIVCFLN